MRKGIVCVGISVAVVWRIEILSLETHRGMAVWQDKLAQRTAGFGFCF